VNVVNVVVVVNVANVVVVAVANVLHLDELNRRDTPLCQRFRVPEFT
jgi:hypothetical protein